MPDNGGPCVCCNAADGLHDFAMHAAWRTAIPGLTAVPDGPLSAPRAVSSYQDD